MNLQTIEEAWRDYARCVYPPEGGTTNPVQERETRQAFYSGALQMLRLTTAAANRMDEAGAMRRVEQWDRELVAYGRARAGELEQGPFGGTPHRATGTGAVPGEEA